MATYKKQWECPVCENGRDSEDEAVECCRHREIHTFFRCSECGNAEYFTDAKEVESHIAGAHNVVSVNDIQGEYDEALRNGYIGGQALWEFEQSMTFSDRSTKAI